MMRAYYKLAIVVFVIVTSHWFAVLVSISAVLGISLMALGIALFAYYLWPTKAKLYCIVGLFLLTSLYGLGRSFYRDAFRTSSLERDWLEKRHQIYAAQLGRAYSNRIGIFANSTLYFPLKKLSGNLFVNLDPNIYFFAGHPRERENAVEFVKFSFLWLPVFLLGLIRVIPKDRFWIIYLLATIGVSVFVDPRSFLDAYLFLPPIGALTSIGVDQLIKRL